MRGLTNLNRKIVIFCLLSFITLNTFSQLVAKSLTASNGTFIGFYQYTPTDYSANPTTKYPVIIFLHGVGERGNGTTDLARIAGPAIPGYIRNKAWNMKFTWNGKTETFLVLAPQLSSSYGSWQDFYVDEMLKFAKANLRIDPNRIFLTGLSLGGGGVWHYASSAASHAAEFAGIAPVCGTCAMVTACNIANAHLPVWAFHALNDGTVGAGCTTGAASNIIKCGATVMPLVTLYPDGGHGIWDRAYDSSHNLQNPNIYEWMLAQNKSLPVNKLPVARAGSDVSVGLLSPVTLNGGGSTDADGTIVRHIWKKISGPASGVLSVITGVVTTITGLSLAGTYQYELTAVDNRCGWTKDTVTVSVGLVPGPNQNPTASAGSNITITLPTNSVTLNGNASSDPDGSISSYSWTKISGPTQFTISNPASVSTSVSNLAQGVYGFRLRVTDNGGLTDDDTVLVTVNAAPANQPPLANAGTDITITLPTNSTTLNGNASTDPDGSISNYSWTKISGPTQYSLSNPNSASTALNNLAQGTYSFRLSITDNGGLSDADTVIVTVNAAPPPPNQAPAANAGGDIAIVLPTNSTTLNGSASSDADGSISSYSWTKISGPAQYSLANPNAASTAVNNLAEGTYSFRLSVTDNGGLTDADTIVVTVNAAPPQNQAPVANAGSDIAIVLPTNAATLNGSASSDADGSISSYSWTKISGPAQYSLANPNAASTAVNNLAEGTYSFRLAVTDDGGLTDADTIVVTVNSAPPQNQAPVANAGSDIAIVLPTNSATLNGSASSDADGSISSYSWTKISGPAQYSLANPNSASTALNNLAQGTYSFRLSITDNGGLSDADTVVVTVNAAPPPPNQAPAANAGSDIAIVLPANSATLNGSASSDPDGSISSYSWTKISGPTQYSIANPNAASTAVNNLAEGAYSFLLLVTDNGGLTDADTIVVTVNAAPPQPNQPPVANAGNDIAIVLPANSATLNGSASSDADGSISSYSWTKISGPAQYSIANPNAASTALNNLAEGTYSFRLSVTDNGGLATSDTVAVTVSPAALPPNEPPVADAGSDKAITLPTSSTTLNGSGSFDPEGSMNSYSWTRISGPGQYKIVNSGNASTTVNNLVEGTYAFQLVVTDVMGLPDADTVVIVVSPAPNQAPVANAGSDINITLPVDNTVLNGTTSFDPDGTISSYSWTKISGPAQYNLTNANSSSTVLDNLAEGTYTFVLTVTDNDGLSHSDTVIIIVTAALPPPNQLPIANAGSDISITLPANSTTLNGSTSSDPDGSISTYSWAKIGGPGSYTIANTGASTSALTNLAEGTYSFVLTVTDNQGASDGDTVIVTVNAAPLPPNQPPVADAGTNVSITLPLDYTNLFGMASVDPDGTIATYSWVKVSGPDQYTVPTPNAVSSNIYNLVEGTYLFSLTVTDNGGLSDVDTVMIFVNATPPPPNQAPVANAGTDIIITLPTNIATLNGTASSDPDGTISNYRWTKLSGPAEGAITSSRAASTQVTDLVQGIYTFRLRVTDDLGLSTSDTVVVTVNAAPPPPNQAPVANAGNNANITLPASSSTLNGTSSNDPDGSISSFVWAKISGPSQYNLVNASSSSTVVNQLVQGTYSFQLTVTDNGGLTDTDTVVIIVNSAPPPANKAPIANAASDISITLPTNSTALNGTASSDPDGSIATYSWTKISGPAQYSIVSPDLSSTNVSNLVQGTYAFRLSVSDNGGLTDDDTVLVIVNAAPPPVNQAPNANAGSDVSIILPTNATTLNGTGSSDPDGTISTYNWAKISGPTQFTINGTNGSSLILNNLVQGTYRFRLTVTDNGGLADSDTVTVIVNGIPNQSPIANAGTNFTVSLPNPTIQLNGTASYDPDGSIASFSWAKSSGAGAITIVNSTTATPSIVGVQEGEYIFELTITDNRGATAKDQVRIVVLKQPNQAPVANAGADSAIAIPDNIANLNGVLSYDPDGNINSYRWKQIAGPIPAVLTNADRGLAHASGLELGEYEFELTITDNEGAVSKDSVKMSVINTLRAEEQLSVYPNPVSVSTVNIRCISDSLGLAIIRVYDLNGRLVKSTSHSKGQSFLERPFSVADLKAGTYILTVTINNKKQMVKKLIKQ